jgi:poly(hydroxyalkanoate) granule-associated protein
MNRQVLPDFPPEVKTREARRRATGAGRGLWLAGLGAAARCGEAGQRLFDRLVERGRPVAARRSAWMSQAKERAGEIARGLETLVRDTAAYERRRLLAKLNVASREDFQLLARRLDALGRKLDAF